MQKIALFIILILTCQLGISQIKIQGVVIDSVHNNILRSVSVSVYEKGKKTVDKVTLTDNFGKFVIEDLKPNIPFSIEFSYTGYQKVFRDIILNSGQDRNIGHINMPFVENEIEAVEVIPPVRMNGDTLEFNADAFQLDTNAVVEDLLRKLPGIVVWGDGAVTYNGREIPSILVNGKPFFGNDMSIALQNIQKDAVKTIQVYDSRTLEKQREDPEDKKYQMNVVLKEGRDKLFFGKIGAGLGTDKRFMGQANFNVSDSKRQATLAYSSSNTNSDLYSIDHLLRNTTFKGIGINADYDSDFLRSGILRQHVLGARYQHDYLATNEVGKTNMLKADVISHWNNTINSSESSTQLLSDSDTEMNFRTNNSVSESIAQNQNANISYNNSIGQIFGRNLSSNTHLGLTHSNRENTSNSFADYQYSGNRSSNEIENFSHNKNQGLDFSTSLNLGYRNENGTFIDATNANYWQKLRFDLTIDGNIESRNSDSYRKGHYINLEDIAESKMSNRSYNEGFNAQRFGLNFNISDFNSLNIGVKVSYYGTDTDNLVYDEDGFQMAKNQSLSQRSTYTKIYYEPKIDYGKTLYSKFLYGRGHKTLRLSTSVAGRFLNDQNVSSLDYRNLKLNYTTFLPRVGLNYNISKTSVYHAYYNLNYNYDQEYPDLDRMRPIYDDINPAYRNYGALGTLKATGVHALSFGGNYSQMRQYGYNVNFNFNYRNYQDGLTDSVVYAESQQQVYATQVSKAMNTYSGSLELSKPYLIGKNQTLNLTINGNVYWGNKYQYLNNELQEMLNNNQSVGINIYYTVVDKYQIGLKNNLKRYRRYNKLATQLSNDYTSYSWNSSLSMSYALTKRWSMNTNATLRYNKSGDYRDDVVIWNANTTYRLLKGNNLEFKVAAYDLLRENKGLFFNNGVTEFTTGYTNILTQYYMLSVSYYPRQFGKKK